MLRDTRRSSKPEYRARYPDARPFPFSQVNPACRPRPRTAEVMAGCRIRCAWESFRDANTGVSQDFTGLTAVVQLHLRVAFGLQALQRCSGLLNRRARGSTVATHHFADVAQQRQQQFRKLPGALPHESASLSIGPISASVVKLLSSSASNGEFAGGSPAGCTNSRACG